MLNSESKISSHFGPLETKTAVDKPILFSIILFAREGSGNTNAWESLERQTIDNWELIIVSPPSGNMAFFNLISEKFVHKTILAAELASLSVVLESRHSDYISFINQDTFWFPDKLSHEYAIFSSSSAVMFFSAPLLIPSQPEGGARIPRYPLKPNQLFTGGAALQGLVEIGGGKQIFMDSISVRRKELLGYFDSRTLSFRPAIAEMAAKEDVFFSDKCLVQMNVPCGMGLHYSDKLVTDISEDALTLGVGAKEIFESLPATQSLETQIRELRIASDAARSDLAAVLSSTSWRLTAPVRHVLRGHPEIRRKLQLTRKLVWWTVTLLLPRR